MNGIERVIAKFFHSAALIAGMGKDAGHGG